MVWAAEDANGLCRPWKRPNEPADFETFETRQEAKEEYIKAEKSRISKLIETLNNFKNERIYPSDFVGYPYDSILKESRCEYVARNIIIILDRTGDNWRDLSWKEYYKEREKDNSNPFSVIYEKGGFDAVIPFCKNAEMAKVFCPTW